MVSFITYMFIHLESSSALCVCIVYGAQTDPSMHANINEKHTHRPIAFYGPATKLSNSLTHIDTGWSR